MFEITFTSQGMFAPSTAEIKTGLQQLFINAFGNGLNLDDSTPQGDLIRSLTEAFAKANANQLYLFNQFNPAYAQSPVQDAIGQIYFLERKPATYTTVMCNISGLPGTIIPAGSQVQDINLNIYNSLGTITIGTNGTATGLFQNTVAGAIGCPANTITTIVSQINGWDSVSNSASGTTGSDVESRAAFESRRQKSVANAGSGSTSSVYSRLANYADVESVVVWENSSSSTITYRGVSLAPYSMYACVLGGTATEIGTAFLNGKSGGCATNGSQICTAIDPTTGISNVYNYDTPTFVSVKFVVTILKTSATPTDIVTQIQNSILATFNGQDETKKVGIGDSIYITNYVYPISQIQGSNLISIDIGLVSSSTTAKYLDCDLNQIFTLDVSNITVVEKTV